jgi:hypothetical protein
MIWGFGGGIHGRDWGLSDAAAEEVDFSVGRYEEEDLDADTPEPT